VPLSDLRPIVDRALESRRSTTEIVATVLRDAIVTGVLRAGEELNQVELARQFGVSRVPVREAIRLLEAQGFVVSQPHRRTTVAALTPELLGEIFEVRITLETLALGAAVGRLTPEDLSALQHLVDAMDRETDHRAWMRLNDRFHDVLYRASGKPFVCRLIGQLRQHVERYFWAAGRGVRRNAAANAEHRRILEACRAGDVARAQEELRGHLQATLEGLATALRGTKKEGA
jgi:DNA-binding GntR family transcriptional regulator